MKNGFTVFLAVLVALGGSWAGFVLAPVLQLGSGKQSTILNSSDIWPQQRTGEATRGLQVFRAQGCAACHTEQLRQNGVAVEVTLTGLGKSKLEEFKGFTQSLFILPELAPVTNKLAASLGDWKGEVPATLLTTDDKTAADAFAERLKAAGLKSEERVVAVGSDLPRWGQRRSVAADYLYDVPVQLGNLRVGPDLASIGTRADANTLFQKLYAPKCAATNAAMPSFRFLFDVRKIGSAPSADALHLPKEFAPADGCEVVPKPEAKELVAYLLSLRVDQPLYEAPFTPVTSAKP